MPSVRSVALGFFIGTGSATEDAAQAGWSHLLEHLLFRGTERYGSLEIDQIFDAMGAELNAGTGKESTSVYSRVLDSAPRARVRRDGRHGLAARDRAARASTREREIVLEEIAMYEDDPQDQVFDLLGEAIFGDHPLGRAVIGTRETVAARRRRRCTPSTPSATCRRDLVVAAAGSVDHERLVALVRARPGRAAAQDAGRPAPPPRGRAAARCASSSSRPSSTTSRSARPASRVTTSAASRCACSTRSSAARRPRGSSRRCARSAGWPTASTRSLALHRRRPGRPLPRHAPRQRRDGAGRDRRRARAAAARTASRDDELARAKDHAKGRVVLRWSRRRRG